MIRPPEGRTGAHQGSRCDEAVVPVTDCGVWKTWRSVQHEAAVRRGRVRLHPVDRRDCRQRVRGGDGHIRRAERQDRDAVIHRQDYAQRLETRPLFLVGYLTREAITAMSSR
jgi:hypothetical protein